jgi:hypothetical protein
MLYLKIIDDTQQAKLFAQYAKTLTFVEVIENDDNEPISKEQLINDIKKSLKEVKTKKTKPLKNLLNGK